VPLPSKVRTAVDQQRGGADSPVDVRGFALLETGGVVGDDGIAVNTGEALLYISRVADAIGYQLGAGPLEEIEVFGRSSAYAAVDFDPDGSVTLSGCVAPSGAPTEDLRAWLQGRSRR
jgi:hypothetical protein